MCAMSLYDSSSSLTQDQHLAVDERQGADRVRQCARLGAADRGEHGIDRRMVNCPGNGAAVVMRDLCRAIASQPVVGGVAHDGEEPGAGVAFAHGVDIAHGANTGILYYVLGVVRVTRQPARKVVRGIQVRQDLPFEALAVVACHELAIPRGGSVYSNWNRWDYRRV